jgi:hypothetical protein
MKNLLFSLLLLSIAESSLTLLFKQPENTLAL